MRWRLAQLIPRRRWQRVLAVVLVLLVVAWFAVPQLFVPMIRAKLQGMIGSRLDAKLQIGRLMYAPPFGVRARDVRLVSGASLPGWRGEVELLRVAKLDLKLAHTPFRKGPLVIQNITVTDPEVHLIRTEDGRIIGMHSFVRPAAPAGEPPAEPPAAPGGPTTLPSGRFQTPEEAEQEAAKAKLSDMFELRHFGVKGGRVVYVDRSRPDLPPVVWKDLDVGMETSRQSKAVYGFQFDANNGELGKINSSGSFDLDAVLVQLGSLHLEARAAYTDEQSPLPAQVQRVLRDYRVNGRVILDASGRFPVREPGGSTYQATVTLQDASAYSPQWDATLDRLSLKLSADNQAAGAAPATAAGAAGAPTAVTPPAATAARPVRVWLEALDAASGDTTLAIDKAEVLLDRRANTWSLAEVAGRLDLGADRAVLPKQSRPVLAGMDARGRIDFTVAADGALRPGPGRPVLSPESLAALVYPRGVSLRPRTWPAAIENLGGGGSVRKDRGSHVVAFQNLTFAYGGDRFDLASARLPLPADLRKLSEETRVEELGGTIDFRRPGPRYPGGFGKVVAALRPVGPFVIGRDSWYSVASVRPDLRVRTDPAAPPGLPPRRKSDYFFSVSTDSGSFTLTDRRIELTRMSGDATVSNMLVDVRRLEADVLGGRISGTMKVTPGTPTRYQGRAYVRGLDLEALSRRMILTETRNTKLSGVGNLDINFALAQPQGPDESVLSTLRAAGEFEVLKGDFWTIPVLGDVAGRVDERKAGGEETAANGKPAGKSVGTIGEAAGVFEVAEGALVLRNAAVSSPALGVVGSGTVGLTGDKRLDLHIVAAPLGDWRAKVKQTNVPILSDVAGEVFGALQRVVSTATGSLLYEFRVTGTTSDRHVQTVPVPVLTEPAAVLFGKMLREGDDRRLLEAVRPRDVREDGRRPPPRRQ